jgi:hypothetical protein
MSQSIQRGIRRLQAIQQSRSLAWIVLVFMLSVAFFAFFALIVAIRAGVFVSAGGITSVIFLVSSSWVAGHMIREVRRLGKLLRDPERIMRAERHPDVVSGIHWSAVLPFSAWRE